MPVNAVDGIARIEYGVIEVTLDDYPPVGGEVFTLIQANSIEGTFREVTRPDTPVADNLPRELNYTATRVELSVIEAAFSFDKSDGSYVIS